jgi:hypothetical protein
MKHCTCQELARAVAACSVAIAGMLCVRVQDSFAWAISFRVELLGRLWNKATVIRIHLDCIVLYGIATVLLYYIILPVVLYDCKTWSLTLREEHRLRVLRRILYFSFFFKEVLSLSHFPVAPPPLEHRASVKRFVSLQFLTLRQS